jgi:cysteine-rich repeat protein
VRRGEECDDGNNRNGDGCSSNCKIEDPVCGNGVIEFNEQCDDDNRRDGDGCSATCRLEDDVVDSIRKLKIQDNIGRLTARQPVPLELPAPLPKTGQLDRVLKQPRKASVAR